MHHLPLALAQKALTLGMEKALQDFGRPICIAACDAAGNLLAFCRMEGAPLRSISIATGKAYTAVRIGISTEAFLARLQDERQEISFYCDPALTALPGGNVVKNNKGIIVGGIGISGLKAQEDHIITEQLVRFCEEELVCG